MRVSASVGMLVMPLALFGLDEIPCRPSGEHADQFGKAWVGGGQGRSGLSGWFQDHPEPFRIRVPLPCHRPVPLPARQDPRQKNRGVGPGGITGRFGRIASDLGAAQRKPALPRLLQGVLRGCILVGWRKNTGKSRDISSQVTPSAGFRSSRTEPCGRVESS
ncbi:hypothetical protein Pden_0107 [Paracoccus denitrificans PD1222]|uniref:Uncharacterized protein n=1 Tax=Paracoccus denitrificans (strain Pd 1222) TaxID=318586 RepID=A1AY80_PARDP|nr:hypothetical protein Pden_0107 [Paracoccus denitrificans PD1222]